MEMGVPGGCRYVPPLFPESGCGASSGSPLTRRSDKQRSVGSTHVNMSSTAAAGMLGKSIA